MTDATKNCQRLMEFIEGIKYPPPPIGMCKIIRFPRQDAKKLKALITAFFGCSGKDRSGNHSGVSVSDEEIIIWGDIENNLRMYQSLLDDPSTKIYLSSSRLEAKRWELQPPEGMQKDAEAFKKFYHEAATTVGVILNSEDYSGSEFAEGRRFLSRPDEWAFSVVDTTDNIRKVGLFLDHLYDFQEQAGQTTFALKKFSPWRMARIIDHAKATMANRAGYPEYDFDAFVLDAPDRLLICYRNPDALRKAIEIILAWESESPALPARARQ